MLFCGKPNYNAISSYDEMFQFLPHKKQVAAIKHKFYQCMIGFRHKMAQKSHLHGKRSGSQIESTIVTLVSSCALLLRHMISLVIRIPPAKAIKPENKINSEPTSHAKAKMQRPDTQPKRGRYTIVGTEVLQNTNNRVTSAVVEYDENALVLSDKLADEMLKDPILAKLVAQQRPDKLR